MQSNFKLYSHTESVARIDEILAGTDTAYEELDSIPSRDRLTFTNGFYVNCTTLFVDIRGSSALPDRYKRPTLAKLYRAYVSEVAAVLNGSIDCSEINIHGDAVWGVFNTPYKRDVDDVFSTAAHVRSLVDILRAGLNTSPVGRR